MVVVNVKWLWLPLFLKNFTWRQRHLWPLWNFKEIRMSRTQLNSKSLHHKKFSLLLHSISKVPIFPSSQAVYSYVQTILYNHFLLIYVTYSFLCFKLINILFNCFVIYYHHHNCKIVVVASNSHSLVDIYCIVDSYRELFKV